MQKTIIALATVFALGSTAAMAQEQQAQGNMAQQQQQTQEITEGMLVKFVSAMEEVQGVTEKYREKFQNAENQEEARGIQQSAQKEMIIPGLLPIIVPIIVGVVLGPYAVGAFLLSATVSGTLLAFMMNTGGAAWDNAKKNIEAGKYGGKGSEAHKAANTAKSPSMACDAPVDLIGILYLLIGLTNFTCAGLIPKFCKASSVICTFISRD